MQQAASNKSKWNGEFRVRKFEAHGGSVYFRAEKSKLVQSAPYQVSRVWEPLRNKVGFTNLDSLDEAVEVAERARNESIVSVTVVRE